MNFNSNLIFFLLIYITYSIGMNVSIFQFNTISNLLQMICSNRFIKRNLVNFFHVVAWMCQPFR